MALARQILASVPEMKQKAERCIGIVTPYRPQAQLLQKLIRDEGLQNWVQAGTVHRFQGLEFDAVIFDTVESPGLAPGEFISGSQGSDSMRLINVAVTRPKQKLYIVANLPHLRQTLSDQATLRLAVEEAARAAVLPSLDIAGTPFSTLIEGLYELEPASDHIQAALAGTLLGKTSADTYKRIVEHDVLFFKPAETSSPGKRDGEEIKHFTEKAVYAAAKQDIPNARKSICIASPYVAPARLNNVIGLLLEQKSKGIHLEIFTKPLDESDNWHREAVQIMLSRGIEPIYKIDMHEKAVIIDKNIMYDGNLNFLSHRTTTNNIYRITNTTVIKEAYELLRLNKLYNCWRKSLTAPSQI